MSKQNIVLSSVHEAEIARYQNDIDDLRDQIEQYKLEIAEVTSSLSSAIEQGNPLFIGIVLGQSLQQLIAIAYK